MAGESNIPLEAVLKVAVDQMGGENVKQFLESYTSKLKEGEESVSRTSSMLSDVADHVGRIGESMRMMGGLVGLASAGAVAQQFMAVSGSGAGLAMAEGHLTGSNSVYGNYAQSLLGVQASTGVAYSQIEEGLRTAAQMVGGNLSPQGAARFGALLAGAGLAGGLSTQAISSVVGSFMESAGMNMGGANGEQATKSDTALLAGVTQALSSFEGTQVSAMLPTVASLYEAQSLRSPGAPKESVTQTASFVNALAEANPLFRNSKNVEAAIEGGNSYLLSGLTNPMVRFAEARAGVSVEQAMEGGPEALEQMAVGLHEQLPGNLFREYLRSTQSPQTAKMMEVVVNHPGLMREAHRKGLEAAVNPNVAAYHEDISKSLASQTPEKELMKIGGQALGLVEGGEMGLTHLLGSPVAAMGATVLGGGYVASLGLRGISAAAQGTTGLAGDAFAGVGLGGALASGVAALGAVPILKAQAEAVAKRPELFSMTELPQLEALRKIPGASAVAKGVAGGINDIYKLGEEGLEQGMSLLFGDPTRSERDAKLKKEIREQEQAKSLYDKETANLKKVPDVVKELEAKYGEKWYEPHHGAEQKKIEGFVGSHLGSHTAGRQALDEEIGQLRKYQELGPEGYWQQKFGESVGKFGEYVDKFLKTTGSHKDTAYEGGGSMHDTGYSPMSAALATSPGMVYAAYLKGGGSSAGTSGAMTSTASYTGASGTWNELLKKYSGGGYGVSWVDQLAGEHPGGGAHPGDRATVEADARKYGVPFEVLWGIYGAESSFGKAPSSFGLTGQYGPSGTSGSFNTDARVAAEDIKRLMQQMHVSLKKIDQSTKRRARGMTA